MTGLVRLDGFNLLPYRSRKRREARNRRLVALAAAGFAGCAAVGAVAGWDAFELARVDKQRSQLEAALGRSSADAAEHGRLTDAESQRRRARETAGPLAAPGARFLALLDALAEAPPGGVVLQRVAQRPQEVELTAFAPDSQTAARWLKHLETVRDVQTVEVVEMKRPVLPAARSKPGKAPDAASGYEFTALVRWIGETSPRHPPKAVSVSSKRSSNK
jgi:Tfp pilus assembly protein PilN